LEPTMDTYLTQFISGIAEQANRNEGIVYMNRWIHNLTFDVHLVLRNHVDADCWGIDAWPRFCRSE
jgi:hypothetical protein